MELGFEIDKNVSLGKGRKLCIFKNSFLLIYWPKNLENWRVDEQGVFYATPFESGDFDLWEGSYGPLKRGQSGIVGMF